MKTEYAILPSWRRQNGFVVTVVGLIWFFVWYLVATGLLCLEEPLLLGRETLFLLWFQVVCSNKVLVNRNVLWNRGICGGIMGDGRE